MLKKTVFDPILLIIQAIKGGGKLAKQCLLMLVIGLSAHQSHGNHLTGAIVFYENIAGSTDSLKVTVRSYGNCNDMPAYSDIIGVNNGNYPSVDMTGIASNGVRTTIATSKYYLTLIDSSVFGVAHLNPGYTLSVGCSGCDQLVLYHDFVFGVKLTNVASSLGAFTHLEINFQLGLRDAGSQNAVGTPVQFLSAYAVIRTQINPSTNKYIFGTNKTINLPASSGQLRICQTSPVSLSTIVGMSNADSDILEYSLSNNYKYRTGSTTTTITYNPGFSATNKLGANVALTLTSAGVLTITNTGTALVPGRYFIGIDITEKDPATLAVKGIVHRDLSIFVVACPSVLPAKNEFTQIANVSGGNKTGTFALTAFPACGGVCFDLNAQEPFTTASHVSLLPSGTAGTSYPATYTPTWTSLLFGGVRVCFPSSTTIAAGTYSYPFRVRDTACYPPVTVRYDTAIVTLTIPSKPTIAKIGPATALSGNSVAYNVAITIPAGNVLTDVAISDAMPTSVEYLSYSSGPAGVFVPGLSYNPVTRVLATSTGNALSAGTYFYTINVRPVRCGSVTNCIKMKYSLISGCVDSVSSCSQAMSVSMPGSYPQSTNNMTLASLITMNPSSAGYIVSGNLLVQSPAVVTSGQYNPANQTIVSGKTFYMKAGARIEITSSTTLRAGVQFQNCTFIAACGDTLWRGIDLQAGGVLGVYSCTFMHADAAIKVATGTTSTTMTNLMVDGTTFRNNNIGIYYNSTGGSIGLFSGVSASIFEANLPLLNMYTGGTLFGYQTPIQAQAFAGIMNKGITGVVIGNPTKTPNIFRGTHLGLLNYGANTAIYGARFMDLPRNNLHTSFSNGAYSGTGVLDMVQTSLLTINGNKTNTGNDVVSFQRCHTGVRLITCGVGDIRKMWMDDVAWGVRMIGSPSASMKILDNYIRPDSVGIQVNSGRLNSSVEVNFNNIDMSDCNNIADATKTTGAILILDAGTTRNGNLYVSKNDVKVARADVGIFLQGVPGAKTSGVSGVLVNRNKVLLNLLPLVTTPPINDSLYITGIYANSGTGSLQFDRNRVTGTGAVSTAQTLAFRMVNTQSNQYTCNYSHATAVGYRFDGNCASPNGFRADTLGLHYHALELNSNANMGNQTHAGNWWNTGSTHQAVTRSTTAAMQSVFTMKNVTAGLYTTSPAIGKVKRLNGQMGIPGNYVPQSFWMNSVATPNPDPTALCAADPLPIQPEIPGLDSLQRALVMGTYQPELYPYEATWALSAELYERVLSDPALLNYGAISLYCDSLTDETPAQFAELQYALSQTYRTQADSVWVALKRGLLQHRDLLHITDSLIAFTVAPLDLDALYARRDSLLAVITADEGAARVQDALLAALRAQGIAEARLNNSLIPVQELFEANYQATNEVYLRLLAEETEVLPTAADKELLLPIAWQCPVAGGPGVATAREILSRSGYLPNYPDEQLCLQMGTPLRPAAPAPAQAVRQRLVVHPNPAHNLLTVSWTGAAQTIQIMDMTGRNMLTLPVTTDGSQQCSIEALPAGAYLVRTQHEGVYSAPVKLIIIR